eukprot:scpid48273/ scgid18343/ 
MKAGETVSADGKRNSTNRDGKIVSTRGTSKDISKGENAAIRKSENDASKDSSSSASTIDSITSEDYSLDDSEDDSEGYSEDFTEDDIRDDIVDDLIGGYIEGYIRHDKIGGDNGDNNGDDSGDDNVFEDETKRSDTQFGFGFIATGSDCFPSKPWVVPSIPNCQVNLSNIVKQIYRARKEEKPENPTIWDDLFAAGLLFTHKHSPKVANRTVTTTKSASSVFTNSRVDTHREELTERSVTLQPEELTEPSVALQPEELRKSTKSPLTAITLTSPRTVIPDPLTSATAKPPIRYKEGKNQEKTKEMAPSEPRLAPMSASILGSRRLRKDMVAERHKLPDVLRREQHKMNETFFRSDARRQAPYERPKANFPFVPLQWRKAGPSLLPPVYDGNVNMPDMVVKHRKLARGPVESCAHHRWTGSDIHDSQFWGPDYQLCLSADGPVHWRHRVVGVNLREFTRTGDLLHITDLCLSGHLFRRLPHQIGLCISLKSLIMDNNQLSSLCRGVLKKLTKLEHLSVAHNKLADLATILEELQHNRRLMDLNIDDNPCMKNQRNPESQILRAYPRLEWVNGRKIAGLTFYLDQLIHQLHGGSSGEAPSPERSKQLLAPPNPIGPGFSCRQPT